MNTAMATDKDGSNSERQQEGRGCGCMHRKKSRLGSSGSVGGSRSGGECSKKPRASHDRTSWKDESKALAVCMRQLTQPRTTGCAGDCTPEPEPRQTTTAQGHLLALKDKLLAQLPRAPLPVLQRSRRAKQYKRLHHSKAQKLPLLLLSSHSTQSSWTSLTAGGVLDNLKATHKQTHTHTTSIYTCFLGSILFASLLLPHHCRHHYNHIAIIVITHQHHCLLHPDMKNHSIMPTERHQPAPSINQPTRFTHHPRAAHRLLLRACT